MDAEKAKQNNTTPPSLHIVVARCNTQLMWLWDFDFPPNTRVFIYEKCNATDWADQASGLPVDHVVRTMSPDGELMTGECTVYLTHILMEWEQLADYTIFLHDDAPRHIQPGFLNLALRMMNNGMYDVPFLHLTHERYAQHLSPCFLHAFKAVFGKELQGPVSSYCCSHFIVSRERILAPGYDMVNQVIQTVHQGTYTTKGGGICEVGHKPCYLMEFFWHVLFGEDDILPLRSLNTKLPPGLRYEGGRFNDIPSGIRTSQFLDVFKSTRIAKLIQGHQEVHE